MIVLGLTGSIATGKSTVAEMLKRLGVPIHSADLAVHTLMKDDESVKSQIQALCPDCIVDSTISRPLLMDFVRKTPGALQKLEEILHPKVKLKTLEFISHHRKKGTKMICLEIPLLFEKNLDRDDSYGIDYIICVHAPDFLQRIRALQRPDMTLEKFKFIRKHQMPIHKKIEKSDFVIETGLSKHYTLRQIHKISNQILNKEGSLES